MQMEALEAVHRESRRLPPIQKVSVVPLRAAMKKLRHHRNGNNDTLHCTEQSGKEITENNAVFLYLSCTLTNACDVCFI